MSKTGKFYRTTLGESRPLPNIGPRSKNESMAPKKVFAAIQEHAISKPDSIEEHPWGDVAWKAKGKMFAVSSEDSNFVTVKLTLEEQAALVMHPQIEISKYVGRYGWVTIEVDNADTLELAKDLVDESYDSVVKPMSAKIVNKNR